MSGIGAGLFGAGTDEEHEAFRESVQRFLAAEADPGADPRTVLAAAGQHGFLGIAVPEEHSGGGADDLLFGVVFAEEAMRRGATAVAARYGLHTWVAVPALARYASPQQRRRWLPGLASGAELVAVAGLHSEAADRVRLEERGATIGLSGTVAGVPGAEGADLLVLVVQDGTGPRTVVLGTDQVELAPVLDELGAPGLGTADVVVDAEVPVESLLAGRGAAAQLRADHDLWFAVLGVSGARAALEQTVRYVRQRAVFGRPLAEFENTRRALASVSVDLAAAHALVEQCARARAHACADPARAAAAGLAASAVHTRSVDEGLQLHGGYGYMREYPIAQAFADAARLRLETVRDRAGEELVARALGL